MGKGFSGGRSLDLEAPELSAGLQPSDLLALPEPQSSVLTWMIRREAVTFVEVMAFLGVGRERRAPYWLNCMTEDFCTKSRFEVRGTIECTCSPNAGVRIHRFCVMHWIELLGKE